MTFQSCFFTAVTVAGYGDTDLLSYAMWPHAQHAV